MYQVFKRRNPLAGKYLEFIPAIYFMLLGMFDIGMDLWEHKFRLFHFLVNAILCLPILFRRKIVYLICGICFSILWLYLSIGGLIVMRGNTHITILQAWLVEAWLVFSLVCSLSLLYVGSRRNREGASQKDYYFSLI